ncbi:hypothetical protein [Paenilisteria newyorkensis]|uniref:hypothetical protein n=1 Tax=Listeria newyorkensis TaxID=1497681 RepID=UPI000669FFEE|nr:hypothetical protein [Listeria newyorkensis]KMT62696.1 hypothetical protein X559_0979 [Listeria newyorkensis]
MMNAKRRKRIQDTLNILSEQLELLEELKNEEQEYVDNVPENLQGTERYEAAEEAAANLDEAYDLVNDVIEKLEEVIE